MSLDGNVVLENAHRYRIHQDLVRWSLLAGYGAFLTATLALIMNKDFLANQELQTVAAVALFLIGNCYLFVLAVEKDRKSTRLKSQSH